MPGIFYATITYGGIRYRQMGYTIADIETNTIWDEISATGNVEASVEIGGLGKDKDESEAPGIYLQEAEDDLQPVLCAYLIDREGNECDRIFPLLLEEKMQFCMRVEDAHLWNAEDPYCYQLILEIAEGEAVCQDRRAEPIAFYEWNIVNGQSCINGKTVSFRAEIFPADLTEPGEIQTFLQKMKQNYQNTLLVKTEVKSRQLEKWCLEYGIYLLEEGKDADTGWLRARLELEGNKKQTGNPDFQIQVVQSGALIENKSTFVDASEYELHYEICDCTGRIVSESRLYTEIPAGTSKYVDIPFEKPTVSGEYIYRVSLCLRKDTCWAPKGYAVACAETKISNFYEKSEIN